MDSASRIMAESHRFMMLLQGCRAGRELEVESDKCPSSKWPPVPASNYHKDQVNVEMKARYECVVNVGSLGCVEAEGEKSRGPVDMWLKITAGCFPNSK